MPGAGNRILAHFAGAIDQALARVWVVALFPIVGLASVWFGWWPGLAATSVAFPGLMALRLIVARRKAVMASHEAIAPTDRRTERDRLIGALQEIGLQGDQDSACILIQIDDWDGLMGRWGHDAAEDVAERAMERMAAALRRDDMVVRLGDARFGVVLHPQRAVRLGTRIAICDRLRACVAEPIVMGGLTLRLTASGGHAGLRHDGSGGAEATALAAEAALADALHNGPDAVRAYAPALGLRRRQRSDLAAEVETALSADEFRAWFQPHIATESGVISGFEVLARWQHPERGLLLPADFLPAVQDAGRMDQLGQRVLQQAIAALRRWDQEGLRVPSISVNLSTAELRNPALADHIAWEIDKQGLRPGRLSLDIPEAVASQPEDDTIASNIAALRAHGVGVDLSDFGVSQAALGAIRRFGVTRIKIHPSIISDLDTDPDQHSMIAAILSMARHLGLETLAVGVETAEVQAALSRLGCDHLQGRLIAQAMPLDRTVAWATQHNERLARLQGLGRRAG